MTPMNRRVLVNGFCIAALVPTIARAQEVGKVYRVGVLTPNPASPLPDLLIAALRERGWVVGRNLAVEIHDTKGDPERAEALAKNLVREPVDLIVTNVTATAMAARRATSILPIVMLTSSFPVEGGLAKSLARPGGNVTGMTLYAGGLLFGKFVQLLRELVPTLRELGVLWGYASPSYRPEQVVPATDELRRAAKALNVNVRFWETGTESDLASAGRRSRCATGRAVRNGRCDPRAAGYSAEDRPICPGAASAGADRFPRTLCSPQAAPS